MSSKIELDAPSIGSWERKSVMKAMREGFVSTYGPYVTAFEKSLSDFMGGGYPVAVQSGTAALHMALLEAGIGPGDEVIVPALTFIASANPVLYAGATPVLVDVDAKTWCLSAEEVRRKISSRTRAVICVHLYGNPCDMQALSLLAKEYKISIIEDATESLGSFYEDRHTGLWGRAGCLSFNGNKLITTGGGGVVVCSSPEQAKKIHLLVNQARPTGEYIHTALGYNYRMTNLEASLGLAQAARLPAFIQKKAAFRCAYERIFAGSSIELQGPTLKSQPCFWMNAVLFSDSHSRCKAQEVLTRAQIPWRRIFAPLTESTPYHDHGREDLARSYDIYSRGLCLPSSSVNRVGVPVIVGKCLKHAGII